MENFETWLEQLATATGHRESQGQFEVDSVGCHRAGVTLPGLAEVPLLVLAAAVEGGSRHFALGGESDLYLAWDGKTGPSFSAATNILTHHDVDFRAETHSIALPGVFRDFLTPLWHRCQFAPLSVLWDGREVARPDAAGFRYQLSPSSHARLIVVDRGLAFQLPVAFPGWDLVVWSPEPLPGNPWPMELRWSLALRSLLKKALEEALKQYNRAHAR